MDVEILCLIAMSSIGFLSVVCMPGDRYNMSAWVLRLLSVMSAYVYFRIDLHMPMGWVLFGSAGTFGVGIMLGEVLRSAYEGLEIRRTVNKLFRL
jgi:hypothetical protein